MSLLIESIKVSDGHIENLAYHVRRMNRSVKTLFNLENIFDEFLLEVPVDFRQGLYKCRIIYNQSIQSIEFHPYKRRRINRLQLVFDDAIEYSLKYTDRECFDRHTKQLATDEEILVIKNNFVTDTSYSNIALWDGKKWITPSTPLLQGTKRQQLIDDHLLIEKEVTLADFYKFEKASLINALNNIGDIEIQLNQNDQTV